MSSKENMFDGKRTPSTAKKTQYLVKEHIIEL